MRLRAPIFALMLWLAPGLAQAGGLTFTQDLVATFEFDVLGGTPINPGPDSGWQPYEAVGQLTFTLDSSINDPNATTVPFTDVQGVLNGVYPSSLLPFTISPDVGFLGGDLTNIVRDAGGSIISADVSDLSSLWDLVADGGALVLFGKDGLPFYGTITSIPFANGTQLSDSDQFNVWWDDNGTDYLVAYGRDRVLTAVPEPGSAALAGLAGLILGGAAALRRRRRA